MRHPIQTSRRRSTGRRRGATTVEFAIIAPMFFMFVLGVVEFSRMMMLQHSMTNACREGCRTAILASTDDTTDVDASVRAYLNSTISDSIVSNTEKVRVTVPESLASLAPGTDLTVAIEIDYADVSWLPLKYFTDHAAIGAGATRQRE